ncbi:MAG: DUF1573 domain-containing protein [Patescibacteria group bacterium]|nr:DUF1573 domain-containing protein [Patescibacteria group bacterium]
MNKKTIIISAFVMLGIISLMWWGRNNQTTRPSGTNNGGKSSLVASETLYDFGTISMANGNVDKIFKITNPTDKDITISSIVTSCMCTTAYIEKAGEEKGPFGMSGHGGPVVKANEVIKAGESLDIKVVFNPNAHGPAGVGLIDRLIDLTEANGGLTQLEIKAVVTP